MPPACDQWYRTVPRISEDSRRAIQPLDERAYLSSSEHTFERMGRSRVVSSVLTVEHCSAEDRVLTESGTLLGVLTRCNSIARPARRTKDMSNLHFKRRGYFSVKFPRLGGHQVKPERDFRQEVSNEREAETLYT